MNKTELVAQVANLVSTAIVLSNDNYSVFVHWSPHVDGIDVDVHLRGWSENKPADISKTIYLNWETASEELDAVLAKIMELAP